MLKIESPVFDAQELARIQKILGLSVGSPVDVRRLDEGIQTLYKQGRLQSVFVEAVPEARGLHLYVRGSRIRKLRRIRFSGVDPEVLDEARRKLNFEEGELSDTRTFAALRERLKSAYDERGYPFAEVQILISDVPDTQDADVQVSVLKGQPTLISKITVAGASGEENARLRNLVLLKKGERYSKLLLEDGLEKITRYLRGNQYPTARVADTALVFSPDRQQVEVNILVKLGERYQFEFSGNRVFDEPTLRELLTEEILAQADASQKIVELIRNKYREVGYHFCSVDVKNNLDPMGNLNIVRFRINEGSKVLIDKLEFSGGDALGPDRLEALFYEGAPGVIERHIYWEEGMKPAVANLNRRLEAMGYLSAAISGPRAVFSDDRKGVQLFFDADPGTQTRIASVDLDGVKSLPRSSVEALYLVKQGEPLNRAQVEETRRRILQYYASEGYSEARFSEADTNESIAFSKDQKRATVHFHVMEGTQFFVGKVTIEGLKKTQSVVVEREMKLKTGDKYNPALVQQSEEDLAALGLFSREEIIATNDPAEPSHKDLKVALREAKPGVGEVGLGGYYEDPILRIKTFFGLAYRNLFGLNQTASVRTNISLPFSPTGKLIPFLEYGAVLGYRSPYPFSMPLTFVTEAGIAQQEINPDPNVQRLLTQNRIEARIERKFSKRFTGLYRLHHFETSRTQSKVDATTHETIGSTGPGLIFDFRNDIFNPTHGSFHTLDFEFGHPWLLSQSTLEFMEIISRNSFFVPLIGPFGFSFYVGVGYAYSLSGNPLPTVRRTFDLSLGGQGSIRGYTPYRFTPPDGATEAGYYNIRSEMTIALFANVSAAIFFDTGQLLHRMVRDDGVGIGIRYKTPVGPVVIDIAQGLTPGDKEAVRFYFTVGTF